MRVRHLLLVFLPVVGLAYWVTHESNKTRQSIKQVNGLETQLRDDSQRLEFLSVEWEYLNRPDRLEALVERYFDQLRLVEAHVTRYGEVESIPFYAGEEVIYDQESGLLMAVPSSPTDTK